MVVNNEFEGPVIESEKSKRKSKADRPKINTQMNEIKSFLNGSNLYFSRKPDQKCLFWIIAKAKMWDTHLSNGLSFV